ncbi:MAG: sugar nucleotide-binding protein [Nanoarchaeota archaeon]
MTLARNLILIGANEPLGYSILEQLEQRHELYPGMEQLAAYDLKEASPIQKLDLADLNELERALEGYGPETSVMNVAAYHNVDGAETPQGQKESHRASVEGPRNLAHLARQKKFRVIHLATAYGYGKSDKGLFTEQDRLDPNCQYATDKVAGQHAIEEVGGWALVTEALYGPKGKHFIRAVLDKIYLEDTAAVVQDQTGSPTYTRDLATLFVTLAVSEQEVLPRGRIHAVNQGACSRAEWAEEAVRYLQRKKRLPPVARIDRIGTDQFNNREYNGRWKYHEQVRKGEDLTHVRLVAHRPINCSLATPILNLHGLSLRPWKEALHNYLDNEYRPPK